MNLFDKEKTYIAKGVAILLLLFHHLFLVRSRLEEQGIIMTDHIYNNLYPHVVKARICVWIFVFLSAYGLTIKFMSYEKSNLAFVLSRWIELMKKWWIVLICCMIIHFIFVGSIWDYYQHNWKYIILDIFEWNDFFDKPRIFGSWYLCFAQILILFIPFFNAFCEKLGWISLPIIYILMQFAQDGIISSGGGSYLQYLLTVIAGTLAAQTGLMNKLLGVPNKLCLKILECTLLLGTILFVLEIKYSMVGGRWSSSVLSLIAAFLICLISVKYFKIMHKPLKFLGRHSAVMFMTNVYFYKEFGIVYITKTFIGSYITLIIVTLAFSIIVEFISKYSGYNALFNRICKKIEMKVG